ncbi:MAG: hypothetical protein HY299_18965 [Verrucomicrobia bacterium]|nr:hypothetical protein [Verrucomicrobiota bacterium]
MKKLILTLSVGMLGAFAVQAQDVDVTFTGSTAFRGTVYNAIKALYAGTSTENATTLPASGASRVTLKGKMASVFGATRNVTVRLSWSGSGTGAAAVANGTPVTVNVNATPQGDAATTTTPATFAFSDVFQTSTTVANSPSMTDTVVGVIPFVWVKNTPVPASVDNITAQNARAIFGNGRLPVRFFTGVPTDTGIVNVEGRDSGSGTRITVLSETGVGGSATIVQRKVSAGNYVADAVGFSGGGALATDLALNVGTSANGAGGAIGYLGLGDAPTVTGAGGAILKYEGVPMTFDNVRSGKYTLWAYEHCFDAYSVAPGSDEDTLRTALATEIEVNQLATSTTAIQFSTMKSTRLDDGATVTP